MLFCFNPYKGFKPIATMSLASPCRPLRCFNPYKGFKPIATHAFWLVKAGEAVSIPIRVLSRSRLSIRCLHQCTLIVSIPIRVLSRSRLFTQLRILCNDISFNPYKGFKPIATPGRFFLAGVLEVVSIPIRVLSRSRPHPNLCRDDFCSVSIPIRVLSRSRRPVNVLYP